MEESNNYTPHPAIKGRYEANTEKQGFLREVFDAGSPYYEGILKWGFFGTGDHYRTDALRRNGLTQEMKLLDVAAGSGTTARAACKILESPSQITCVEPSHGMLDECRKNLPECNHVLAAAEEIPLDDAQFDYLTMGFALRHVDNLLNAFKEYARVLKPGGKVCILEITLPKSKIARLFLYLYLRHILPMLTKIFTRSKAASEMMTYYWDTIKIMVAPDVVMQALREAGFEEVSHKKQMGLFSEYTGKKASL